MTSFACIPQSNVCDGIPNCDLREDEEDEECRRGTTSPNQLSLELFHKTPTDDDEDHPCEFMII